MSELKFLWAYLHFRICTWGSGYHCQWTAILAWCSQEFLSGNYLFILSHSLRKLAQKIMNSKVELYHQIDRLNIWHKYICKASALPFCLSLTYFLHYEIKIVWFLKLFGSCSWYEPCSRKSEDMLSWTSRAVAEFCKYKDRLDNRYIPQVFWISFYNTMCKWS